MERKKHMGAARMLTASSALLLTVGTAWDTLRLVRGDVSPAVSYGLVGFAVALGCSAVLLRALRRMRTRARNAIELFVIGLVLLAWWLRGDAGIPADPPLVVAELIGAVVLGVSALFAGAAVRAPSGQL